jgi:hypothetical protein
MTKPRDVDLDRLDGAQWRLVRPEPIGDQLGRDGPIALEQQDREHAPLPGAAEIERGTIRQDPDLAEKTEFELHVGSPTSGRDGV